MRVLPRRDFLKGLGAAAATGAAACRTDGDSDAAGPGSIETVVLVMMENRSFDHVLGTLASLEGRTDVEGLRADLSNPLPDGTPVAPFLSAMPCADPDPPHGWEASHRAFSEGTNQGFVTEMARSGGIESAASVMAYLDRAHQPVSYALADRYAICQRWFSSVMGPTWPNRLFFHGAQSQGSKSNELAPGGEFYSMATIWDQLDEAGIDWAYYYTDLPMLALFGRFSQRMQSIDAFYAAAAAGGLPAVVMVEPGAGFNDDHPPHHTMLGQIFLSSVHNALASSPQWNRCMGIVTYDEAGGFYDHVPPPTTADDLASEGFDQLGFRVPAYVFGPFVKQGHVSDVQFDHSSALAEIQRLLGLEPLNARNAAANDLSSLIDEARLAANDPAPPADLPVIELSVDEIQAECSPDRSRRTGQPELSAMLASKGLAHLDRTDEIPELSRQFLERAQALGSCIIR